MDWLTLIGWTGTLTYLVAQVLLASNRCQQGAYVTLNLYGSLATVIYSLSAHAIQPVAINSFWLLLSILGSMRERGVFSFRPWITSNTATAFAIGVPAVMLACYPLIDLYFYSLDSVQALAWVSLATYISSYALFLFFGLPKQVFLMCSVMAPGFLIPSLLYGNLWPVLVIQISWLAASLAGLSKNVHESIASHPAEQVKM